MLVSLVRFQSSAPFLNSARWGPFYVPHLAARSRPPKTAGPLRRSLASYQLRSVGPLYIPHLAARSRPPKTAGPLRRSLASSQLRSMGPLLRSPSRCAFAPAEDGGSPPALTCFLSTPLDGAPFTFPISGLRSRVWSRATAGRRCACPPKREGKRKARRACPPKREARRRVAGSWQLQSGVHIYARPCFQLIAQSAWPSRER